MILAPGNILGNSKNIGEIRSPKGINALRIVTHDHYVIVIIRQKPNDLGLQMIRVLILIHEHMTPPVGNLCPDSFVFFEKLNCAQQ